MPGGAIAAKVRDRVLAIKPLARGSVAAHAMVG
jgi:hypothetical protein